jgi:hypothetical protein
MVNCGVVCQIVGVREIREKTNRVVDFRVAHPAAVLYKSRDFVRATEQRQCLVHEMGTQVISVSHPGRWLVFPCIFQTSAEAVKARYNI